MKAYLIIVIPLFTSCRGFAPQSALLPGRVSNLALPASTNNDETTSATLSTATLESRRQIMQKALSSIPILALITGTNPSPSFARVSGATDQSNQYAPEFVQKYEDFIRTEEGWQYKDAKVGTGDVSLETGDRAVFAWSGYTIGYFGRPFEAKGGPVGGTIRHCNL
jgi:hypothetical protein